MEQRTEVKSDDDLSELCKRQNCDAATSARKTVSAQEPLQRNPGHHLTEDRSSALLVLPFCALVEIHKTNQ